MLSEPFSPVKFNIIVGVLDINGVKDITFCQFSPLFDRYFIISGVRTPGFNSPLIL